MLNPLTSFLCGGAWPAELKARAAAVRDRWAPAAELAVREAVLTAYAGQRAATRSGGGSGSRRSLPWWHSPACPRRPLRRQCALMVDEAPQIESEERIGIGIDGGRNGEVE
jgi:hypothetical protein